MAAPVKDPNPARSACDHRKVRRRLVVGVNEAAGSIAVYAVSVVTPNSIKMRRLADGKLSINMEDALDELTNFLTSGRAKCSVTEMVDDKGEPCLVINLMSRIPHNKRPVPEAPRQRSVVAGGALCCCRAPRVWGSGTKKGEGGVQAGAGREEVDCEARKIGNINYEEIGVALRHGMEAALPGAPLDLMRQEIGRCYPSLS